MPLWNQGYPAGVEYIKLAKNELSPAHLTFCQALSGKGTVDLDGPFTYAELGSGFGLSILGWAAQYPQGHFFCVDYSHSQTDWTRKLAKELGLGNLTVYTASVREMLERDLPPCDFIVLHGLYSWVSDTVRRDIRMFLRKNLAPGGCAYVSYNTLPGNKDTDAMRRLLHESLAHMEGMRHHKVLYESLSMLKDLKRSGAAFFTDNPGASSMLERWGSVDPDYLVGELMPKEHKSFYFSEIHEEMRLAGLRWTGSAGVRHYLEALATSGSIRALLAERGLDPVLRETIKDFCFSTAFRQDLFTRETQDERLRSPDSVLAEISFCLREVRDLPPAAEEEKALPKLTLPPEVNRRIQSALAPGPARLEDTARKAELPEDRTLEALAVLVALGLAYPSLGHGRPGVKETVKKLNLSQIQAAQEGTTAPLLSANGGWAADWDPLPYAYLMARLLGGDVLERMRRELKKLERQTDGMDFSQEQDGALRQTIAVFLAERGGEMEELVRRHNWT